MNKIKKYIPNILTSLRIIFIPLIIFLGIHNQYSWVIAIAIVIALTDFADGYLARKWNVVSKLGANMDTIADKLLTITLVSLLIIKRTNVSYILIVEVLIALLNLYFYFKKGVNTVLLIGKFKTWIVFMTLILGLIAIVVPEISFFVDFAVYFTVGLQIITLIAYICYQINSYREKKKTN